MVDNSATPSMAFHTCDCGSTTVQYSLKTFANRIVLINFNTRLVELILAKVVL